MIKESLAVCIKDFKSAMGVVKINLLEICTISDNSESKFIYVYKKNGRGWNFRKIRVKDDNPNRVYWYFEDYFVKI